MVLGVCHY